jgi:hypothetical protein
MSGLASILGPFLLGVDRVENAPRDRGRRVPAGGSGFARGRVGGGVRRASVGGKREIGVSDGGCPAGRLRESTGRHRQGLPKLQKAL